MNNLKLRVLIFILLASNLALYAQSKDLRTINSGGFEYEDCGCQVGIDLLIFNGLGSFGGTQVPNNALEVKLGAVTVANLNDTNGNTIPDSNDNTNGVVASAVGRDELDLMKLTINPIGPIPANCTGKVRLDVVGSVKLWRDSRKLVVENQREFNISSLPLELHVEALAASNSNQDIQIKAFIGNNFQDEVRATAIWVSTNARYVSGSIPNPNNIVNASLSNIIISRASANNDLYGLGYFTDVTSTNPPLPVPAYGGRILIEFELIPASAKSFNLFFDITRRLNEESGEMNSGTGVFSNDSNDMFLPQVEMPNDDTGNGDEDVTTSCPVMYSYDGPASNIGQVSALSYIKWIGDFEEFVRVSFHPFPAAVESIEGSRCSDIVKWCHGRTLVAKSKPGAIDKYNSMNQEFQVINSAASFSTPIRTSGNGTGNISINLLGNAITQGYSLFFSSPIKCELRSNGQIVDSKNITNSKWNLKDPGKLEIEISNNTASPFTFGTQLNFSVLNDNRLFNNVKIN